MLWSFLASAQFTDDFSDSNFIANPNWMGNTSDFDINSSLELQLNATPLNSESSLVTPSSAIGNSQFEFYCRLDFDPSTANFARVYLTSTNSNLSGPLSGYFVQIGGASGAVDDVSLYYQNSSSITKIIDGVDGTVAISPELYVLVTRDMMGNWELKIDTNLSGNYISQGTVTHSQASTSSYFGIFCKYSSTRSDKFFFDDFSVSGGPVVDIFPPVLDSLVVVSSTEIDLYFNEPLEHTLSEIEGNYFVNSAIGNPNSALANSSSPNLIHLQFSSPLQNNTTYVLSVMNIQDTIGNVMATQNISFLMSYPQPYGYGSVVINEIFADPTPTNGLPEVEYIELYNTTNSTIHLGDWEYSDASSSVTLPDFLLESSTYVVLCKESDTLEYSSYGPVLGLANWPTLNNSGDNLGLRDGTHFLIDTVNYTSGWYSDSEKEAGGFSLERKNPRSVCEGTTNWGASIASNGGTPGMVNSIFDSVITPFEIRLGSIIHTNQIQLIFSKPIEPNSISPSNFTIEPYLQITDILSTSNEYNNLILTIFPEMETGKLYKILLSGLQDCEGKGLANDSFAMAYYPKYQDLLLNEVLFNPKPGGSDFIELYNTTEFEIDVRNWTLMYLNNSGDSAHKLISNTSKIIQPNSFLVLSEDSLNIQYNYPNYQNGVFLEMDLPTYSNTEGTITVLNQLDELNDQFLYNEEMHLEIITDPKGVSLERTNYFPGPNSSNNWHSAASSIGYATPGYTNSQFVSIQNTQNNLTLNPKTFSPNNDGYHDILSIQVAFNQTDFIGTLSIHTSNGILVNTLINNQSIGTINTFFWDGTNAHGELMPTGMYIVMLRVYDLDNNQQIFKDVTILALP